MLSKRTNSHHLTSFMDDETHSHETGISAAGQQKHDKQSMNDSREFQSRFSMILKVILFCSNYFPPSFLFCWKAINLYTIFPCKFSLKHIHLLSWECYGWMYMNYYAIRSEKKKNTLSQNKKLLTALQSNQSWLHNLGSIMVNKTLLISVWLKGTSWLKHTFHSALYPEKSMTLKVVHQTKINRSLEFVVHDELWNSW